MKFIPPHGAAAPNGIGPQSVGIIALDPARIIARRETVQRPSVVVIVVHGMGEQKDGETVLEWAEPFLGRLDWLTKHTGAGTQTSGGVTIASSVLHGPAARIDAVVTVAGQPEKTRVSFLEATWSRSFIPVSRAETFTWGAAFLWRAAWRAVVQITRTSAWTSWLRFRARSRTTGTGASVLSAVDLVSAVLGWLFSALVAAVVFSLSTVLSPVLLVLSPLLLIPPVKKVLQPIADVLVAFVGDVATYRNHPLREAAMKGVVSERIAQARASFGESPGRIVIVAHSQGTAITLKALLEDPDLVERTPVEPPPDDPTSAVPTLTPPISLHTLGTAICLLGDSRHYGAGAVPHTPVAAWNGLGEHRFDWQNYWAVWDPIPSGPVGDGPRERNERWKAWFSASIASPKARALAANPPGPGEHSVCNTAFPFTDHQSYPKNIQQVIDPIVSDIVPGADGRSDAERLARIDLGSSSRRSRPLGVVASVLIAVASLHFAFAGTIATALAGFIGELPFGAIGAAGVDLFEGLADGTVLSPFWLQAACIALLAAVFAWAYQLVCNRIERRLIWPKDGKNSTGPLTVRLYLAVTIWTACGYASAAILLTAKVVPVVSDTLDPSGGAIGVALSAVLMLVAAPVTVWSVFRATPRPLEQSPAPGA